MMWRTGAEGADEQPSGVTPNDSVGDRWRDREAYSAVELTDQLLADVDSG